MKKISVLGSTGSIGTQGLDVIRRSGGEFSAVCICAGKNIRLLAQQANLFRPELVGIYDKESVAALRDLLSYSPKIVAGDDASQICASYESADTVLNGISGIAGFLPLMAALKSGKTVAAANKESILCAHSLLQLHDDGSLVKPFPNGAQIIPVDSEQSAIFQCLENKENIKSLILTASGGAFRDMSAPELEKVTVEDALKHPTWSMGKKITVDSASLVNKGLEVMEAAFLFGFGADSIEVLIHRQSIVHSMVRFYDGSVKAQLSIPDMRGAIQYAFTYPKRIQSPVGELDLTAQELSFSQPDIHKYPALPLAYEALHEGRVLPVVYNAASEIATELFIRGECRFTDIAKIMAYAIKTADTHVNYTDVCDIIQTDREARIYAKEAARSLSVHM